MATKNFKGIHPQARAKTAQNWIENNVNAIHLTETENIDEIYKDGKMTER